MDPNLQNALPIASNPNLDHHNQMPNASSYPEFDLNLILTLTLESSTFKLTIQTLHQLKHPHSANLTCQGLNLKLVLANVEHKHAKTKLLVFPK